MTIHLDIVGNAWEVLDARDVESSHLTPFVDSSARAHTDERDEYDEFASNARSLVVVDRAQITAGWRGEGGLGRLVIQRAIDLVAEPAGMLLVALESYPYLEKAVDGEAPASAIAATDRTRTSIGFTCVGDSRLLIRSIGLRWVCRTEW